MSVEIIESPLFRNYYAGSNGRVYIKKQNRYIQQIQFLYPKAKYLSVFCFKDNNKYHIPSHKLIANSFFGIDITKYQIYHVNKNPFDNRPNNLKYRLMEQTTPDNFEYKQLLRLEKIFLNSCFSNSKTDIYQNYKRIKETQSNKNLFNYLYINLKIMNLI